MSGVSILRIKRVHMGRVHFDFTIHMGPFYLFLVLSYKSSYIIY